MKLQIKKIIAREGLVVLGIIGASCLLLFISSVYPPIPKSDIYGGFTQAERKSIGELMDFREKYPEYDDLNNLELAEKLANKYPGYQQIYKNIKSINERNKNQDRFDVSTAKPPKNDYYAEEIEGKRPPRDLLVELAETKRARIGDVGFHLLFIGYPVYLIIRFILWAVRTLKHKETK